MVSPLEEMLAALFSPTSRTEIIKAAWATCPPDLQATITAEEPLIYMDDETTIRFELITYGDKRVVEAEGVIVCHLIG